MPALNKFNSFADELSKGGHNLQTAVFKVALTATAPVATDLTWNVTAHPAPAAANNYTAGGNTITTTSATSAAGVFKLVLADTTFTATPGGIGPVRYAVLYNSSAANKGIGWYDYGTPITLADGETLTVDFDGTNGVLTIQ
jgi:hypothetical protein